MAKIVVRTYLLFDELEHRRFKKFLIDNNLTTKKAAELMKISYSYIYAIICGKRVVNRYIINKFNKIGFKLSVETKGGE